MDNRREPVGLLQHAIYSLARHHPIRGPLHLINKPLNDDGVLWTCGAAIGGALLLAINYYKHMADPLIWVWLHDEDSGPAIGSLALRVGLNAC